MCNGLRQKFILEYGVHTLCKPVFHFIPFCFWTGGKKQVVIEQTNLCSEFKLENIYYGVKNVKKWQTLEPAKISAK